MLDLPNSFQLNLKKIKDYLLGLLRKIISITKSVFLKIFFFIQNYFLVFSITVIIFLVGIFIFYHNFVSPPEDFPVGAIVKIEGGLVLSDIANKLYENHVIKSPVFFQVMAKLLMSENQVMAGNYYFENKYSSPKILWRMVRGDCGISPTKVRIVEGYTIYDIAETLNRHFEDFDTVEFLKLAEKEEGYLFPDTYYFLPNVTPKDVIKTMKTNFEVRLKEIEKEIEESGKKLEEIVIMASILEKEARTLHSKQTIAGILWKRIDIGMPLQVDAVFPYINGKNTYQLSLTDLKTDSPYNTYLYKGLPVGPIANPSIYSLLAAATPVESDYLFYLSDLAGKMYYAEDFEKHKENKRLYMYNK